jgi:hypothetical protein
VFSLSCGYLCACINNTESSSGYTTIQILTADASITFFVKASFLSFHCQTETCASASTTQNGASDNQFPTRISSLFLTMRPLRFPQTETCAPASTTQNGALVTVQPVADNSLVRRTLADRAAKQLREERWMSGSRHSERHFVNKNGHRIYTQQWLPDGTPMK